MLEETGLRVIPRRCVFVLEVAAPDRSAHIVELVFLAAADTEDVDRAAALNAGEPGRTPVRVRLGDLAGLTMRPPIAGHLRSLHRARGTGAPYLGNVWRPDAAQSADLGLP